MPDLLETNRIK